MTQEKEIILKICSLHATLKALKYARRDEICCQYMCVAFDAFVNGLFYNGFYV